MISPTRDISSQVEEIRAAMAETILELKSEELHAVTALAWVHRSEMELAR